MKLVHLLTLAGLTIGALQGCSKHEEPATAPSPSATAPVPDVGKVDTVSVRAEGIGVTPAQATSEAMKSAILQVNGATIDTGSIQVKYGLDITDGKDAASLRATEFAEAIAQKSGGAITNFKIVAMTEPAKSGDPYKVTIEANIAHFTAPANSKKIKVVIGPVKFDTANFIVGTDTYPAEKVAEDIRQKVSVALGQSGRFSILDREISPDIENELNMVSSGQAPSAEYGKLGQALTADLIWTGHVDTLAYNRHARKLMTSDRELVSFSGGWAVSQKLVNVATRQVFAADALNGQTPEVEPTTLGAGINSGEVLQGMESDIATAIVSSILTRTFPVTVVSRDGNSVVLSQGGNSVREGARYAAVSMGAEMKDPQTGESLGRIETPCCQIVVDKVTPKLSYGHLENIKISIDKVTPDGLQLREALNASVQSTNTITPVAAASTVDGANIKVKDAKKTVTTDSDEAPAEPRKPDNRW